MLSQLAWLKLLETAALAGCPDQGMPAPAPARETEGDEATCLRGRKYLCSPTFYKTPVHIGGRNTVGMKQDCECTFQGLFSYQPCQDFQQKNVHNTIY